MRPSSVGKEVLGSRRRQLGNSLYAEYPCGRDRLPDDVAFATNSSMISRARARVAKGVGRGRCGSCTVGACEIGLCIVNERGAPFDRGGFGWMVKARWQEGKAGLASPRSHDPSRHRLHSGQCRRGYPLNSSLSRPQGYSAYSEVYRAVADAIQELLSRREESRIIG